MENEVPYSRNRADPKSIINCVTPRYQALIESLPDELLEAPETELIAKAFGGKNAPDENWAQLKINFWREYESVSDSDPKNFGKKIDFKNVAKGVCGEKHLFSLFFNHPFKFAFLLSRPLEYLTQMEDLHGLSIKEMRGILTMPVGYDAESGLPDTKLIQAKIQIFKYVDSKQKGSIVQKVETTATQKNLNVNVEATPEQLQSFKSVEEIDARLKELERISQHAVLPAGTSPTDVLPVERSLSSNGGRIIDCVPLEDAE